MILNQHSCFGCFMGQNVSAEHQCFITYIQQNKLHLNSLLFRSDVILMAFFVLPPCVTLECTKTGECQTLYSQKLFRNLDLRAKSELLCSLLWMGSGSLNRYQCWWERSSCHPCNPSQSDGIQARCFSSNMEQDHYPSVSCPYRDVSSQQPQKCPDVVYRRTLGWELSAPRAVIAGHTKASLHPGFTLFPGSTALLSAKEDFFPLGHCWEPSTENVQKAPAVFS